MEVVPLDPTWLSAHPLPQHGPGTTKNSRGVVLAVGGGALVPGALRLTGEAALRAGCGKLRMATVGEAAYALGAHVPEAALIALPADDDGEIDKAACALILPLLDRCDTLVLGPGMSGDAGPRHLVEALLAEPRETLSVVLDAACLACAGDLDAMLKRHDGRLVFTPHHGEAARLLDVTEDAVAEDPDRIAREAAQRFGATFVLKASETVIATPAGDTLRYGGGGVGLATAGSGDVLAGVIGGLLSRGADPLTAAGWGVWLHGEAGVQTAAKIGPIGFVARELLPEIPGLMVSV